MGVVQPSVTPPPSPPLLTNQPAGPMWASGSAGCHPVVTVLLIFINRSRQTRRGGRRPADITVSHVTAEFGIRSVSGGEVVETEGRQDEAICGTERRTSAARHRSFLNLHLRKEKAPRLPSPCCGRIPQILLL